MTREVMQQALEALENAVRYHGIMLMAEPPQDAWKYHRVEDNAKQAITAIKKALAQPPLPVQEPVAWGWRYDSCGHAVVNRLVVTETSEPTLFLKNVFARGPFPLYAAPLPVQEPVGEVTEVSDNGFKCEFNWRLAVGTKLYIAPPLLEQEPVVCRFCHSKKGCWTWQCYHCGEIDDVQQPAAQPAPAPMSQPNRFIAYAAASKLQELGYEWVDDAWQQALAAPAPQRPWVGLTDEEIAQGNKESWVTEEAWQSAVWWAEAKLKEKNNG